MKYQRLDLTTIDNIGFKLVLPTRKNTDKYPKYYIEYTLGGRQFQVTKDVKKMFLKFDKWAKDNKLDKTEKNSKLVELFMVNVNAILNGLNLPIENGKSNLKINLYSGVLETINAFLKYQIEQFNMGELAGIGNYSDRNKKLNSFFSITHPDMLIKELTATVWDEFRSFLKKQEKANSTINQYITYVKSWYNWIINYHEVPTINHSNKLKKLDTSQQEKKYKDLDGSLVARFFEIVSSDDKWLRLELITRFVGENTIRPIQVRSIQVKHINIEDQSVKIYDKKSKKWRTIIFTDKVKALIEKIYANTLRRKSNLDQESYLIGGFNALKSGKPYTQNMIKDMLVAPFRVEYPAFKNVNIYDFKHTSITKASKLGNLLEVQKRAGHSKITTTQIYDRSEAISKPITMEELIMIK